MPASGTFTIGYGNDVASVQSDLAVFTAIGAGILSDKWGTWTSSSTTGDVSSYSGTVVTKSDNGDYNWVTYRSADTNDSVKDTKIVCGTSQTF